MSMRMLSRTKKKRQQQHTDTSTTKDHLLGSISNSKQTKHNRKKISTSTEMKMYSRETNFIQVLNAQAFQYRRHFSQKM